MVSNQANKDIVYNESIFKIDAFLNLSVTGFIEQKPNKLEPREKYVITAGTDKNKICYSKGSNEIIELFNPYDGMILYFLKENSFFIFNKNQWHPILQSAGIPQQQTQPSALKQISFTGINKKFTPPDNEDLCYLYMNGESEIDMLNSKNISLTIIIKQNYQNAFNLKWSSNILWPQKTPHVMTQIPNSMDIIRLYKLPETNNFLAEIITQNYQY
jgi:hypothetical protein